jgi:hypothetical protein
VAFLAVRCAQQAIRSIPETATADRFRDEWRTNNVLVRQALRLVDERVQDLARRLSRGCPASADAACFGRTPAPPGGGFCVSAWDCIAESVPGQRELLRTPQLVGMTS